MTEKIPKLPFLLSNTELPKLPINRNNLFACVEIPDNESEDNENVDIEDYDVCEGCHWCTPELHPEKPPIVPLPEGHAISIHWLDERCEGAIEDIKLDMTRIFGSYESASKAILDFYKDAYYDNYRDNKDCYDDNGNTYDKPPFGWACKQYNPTALSDLCCEEKVNLYGDYGDTREIYRSAPIMFISICKIE